MGVTPDQVRAMSFYDFQAAWAGYRAANFTDEDVGQTLTDAETRGLAEAIDRPLLWN